MAITRTRLRTQQTVLHALRGEPGGLTRAELVRRTLLSRPTIAKVVDELLREGPIRELDGERVALAAANGLYVGLDLGHRHVAAAVGTAGIDVLAGPRSSAGIEVDVLGAAALKPAMKLIRDLLDGAGLDVADVRGVGVGVPAPLNRQGKVASPMYLRSFIDVVVADEVLGAFRAEFGEELTPEISCENDANLGALGETVLGAARRCRDAVYVKCSTGIGAGILINGQLWKGHHLFAGELGHTTVQMPAGVDWLPLDLSPCPRCSQALCLESTSSATALIAQLHALDPDEYPADRDFDTLVDDVVATATEHQLAREALLQAGLRIGANLADVTRMLDPEVVILGGKLARAGGIVSQAITDALSSASIGDAATELRVVEPDEVRYSEARGGLVLAVQAASDRLIEPVLQP